MTVLRSPNLRLQNLVPSPTSVVEGTGLFTLPSEPMLEGPTDWVRRAVQLLRSIGAVENNGCSATIIIQQGPVPYGDATKSGGSPDRHPERNCDTVQPGAYRLRVTSENIIITAAEETGLIHACHTLLQLLDPAFGLPAAPVDVTREVACCDIVDAPAFAWRGAHVDVSRHFHPLPWLFSFVDHLSAHKFNVLHLHLTDDQGWRFEVPKYPKLTEVGSHRPGTRYPSWKESDGIPRGGFYSQAQLKSLVTYANSRGITVVPEIDVPGHVRALLAAYPEFGYGEGKPVPENFDVFPEVLWLSDETVAMVEDIFTDLLDVFPSEVIHIGGDECPKRQWRNNPDADVLAASRGLESFEQLQRWFTLHVRNWLAERGRRVVGWDEILNDGEVQDAIIMGWRGTRSGREAMERGYQVVMAPSPVLYFDSYQSDSPDEPYGREPVRTWADVVAFDPREGVAEENLPNLLGVQGQAWSEFFPTTDHLEYMIWPRLCALAEVAWNGPKEPARFEPKLRAHLERLDARAINYRPLDGPRPWQMGGQGARKREPW